MDISRVGCLNVGRTPLLEEWLLAVVCTRPGPGTSRAVDVLPDGLDPLGAPTNVAGARDELVRQHTAAGQKLWGLALVAGIIRAKMGAEPDRATGQPQWRHIYQAVLFIDSLPMFSMPVPSAAFTEEPPQWDEGAARRALDGLCAHRAAISALSVPSMEFYNVMRTVPDFPRPGMTFYDALPLLRKPSLAATIVSRMLAYMSRQAPSVRVDAVVGVCSRGYPWASMVALRANLPLVCLTRAGKLPDCRSVSYEKEDGHDTLELQRGAFDPAKTPKAVLVIDDVMATGGTLSAAAQLIRDECLAQGGEVHGLVLYKAGPGGGASRSESKALRGACGMDSLHVIF